MNTMNVSSSEMPVESYPARRDTPGNAYPNFCPEVWIWENMQNLIKFRAELDLKFDTAKTNTRLWKHVSARIRESGVELSASVCADRWARLLFEFYDVKKRNGRDLLAHLSADVIVKYLISTNKIGAQKGPSIPEAHSIIIIDDDDEGHEQPADNLERRLDHEEDLVGINRTRPLVANRVSTRNASTGNNPSAYNPGRGLDHEGHPVRINETCPDVANRLSASNTQGEEKSADNFERGWDNAEHPVNITQAPPRRALRMHASNWQGFRRIEKQPVRSNKSRPKVAKRGSSSNTRGKRKSADNVARGLDNAEHPVNITQARPRRGFRIRASNG